MGRLEGNTDTGTTSAGAIPPRNEKDQLQKNIHA